MNYRTCKRLHESFTLDEQMNLFLTIRDVITGDIKKQVPLTHPMEKGYVYACLFFYDEVQKEVDKLVAMIEKILEEVRLELYNAETPKMLLELSARVRNAIGEDSLDKLLKEVLAKDSKHMVLMPASYEIDKWDKVVESIFIELFANFANMTVKNTKEVAGRKQFTFPPEYIEGLTPRQKKLLAPAIKMVGFEYMVKLNGFELLPDWSVRFLPEQLPDKFTAKEEEIKLSIKQLMEAHY